MESIKLIKSKEIIEYDIIRIYVTILVILGHCGYYTISTPYGGVDYMSMLQSADYSDTIAHKLGAALCSLIYTFHMPMFMALSGAVLAVQLGRGKYSEYMSFLLNKLKRLILPFIGVTLLYSVPIKFISGYWGGTQDLFFDVVVGQLLMQGNTHLWFLPTLFCEFVIFYFLHRNKYISDQPSIIWISALLAVNILSSKFPIVLLSNILKYAIFFYIGMMFDSYRTTVNDKITFYKVIIIFFLWIIMFFSLRYLSGYSIIIVKVIHHLLVPVTALVGMMFMYGVCYLWSVHHGVSSIEKQVSKNSFGLYLYSDTLNYLLLAVVVNLGGIGILGSEIGSAGVFIGRFLITFVLAWCVTVILRKVAAFKYLV